jgi:glucose-1-phosphate thymidylyltransferase
VLDWKSFFGWWVSLTLNPPYELSVSVSWGFFFLRLAPCAWRLANTLCVSVVQSPRFVVEVIGLIPAGGLATRIAPSPVSKEIYPIGFRRVEGKEELRPKVACHYLLEKMRRAGISKSFIILREGKWDIPGYFVDGALVDIHLAYLVTEVTSGTPYTLDRAYSFVGDSTVAFGFPDIIFQPDNAFVLLLEQQTHTEANVTLGLLPAEDPRKVDMVDWDKNEGVRAIITKPQETHLSHSWCIAVWTPVFTQFLHEYVAHHPEAAAKGRDVSVGEVIQTAIESGLYVDDVPVSDEPYLDIGTSEDLARAIERYGGES